MPPTARSFHSSALASRKQMPGESVMSYVANVRQLIRSAHPTMPARWRNEQLHDKLLEGLRRPIRRHIYTTIPGASADEIITIARNFEAGSVLADGVDSVPQHLADSGITVFAGFVPQHP